MPTDKKPEESACEVLAQEILADPKTNHPLIPDNVEKEIYKLAIKGSVMLVQTGLGWVVARFVLKNPGRIVSFFFRFLRK